MKSYNFLKYSFVLVLLFSACTKNLTEKPKSTIAPDQFFTTQAQCIEAVNGVYSELNAIFGQENLWESIEMGTDLVMYNPGGNVHNEYTFSAANPADIYGLWQECYIGVNGANLVINRVGKATIDQATKNRVVGEAKYLRALYYYILSNSFGAVPLWTDELDVTAVSNLSRTPQATVRAQIEADLLSAASTLPVSYAAADVGRATQGAAYALLAKVYLFDKDWANAQKYAQMVVDGKQYQLINFANLFDVHNQYKNNKESIFEIQFLRNAASNTNTVVNYYYTWYLPVSDPNKITFAGVNFGTTVLIGYENFYPSAVFVSMFESGDLRQAVTLATSYNGQPFTRFIKPNRPWFGAKFWDLDANGRNSGKDMYFMRYADVLLILAEAMNEQGNPSGAIPYINQVRSVHGGLAGIAAGAIQSDVRNIIMKERAIEFAGEFQRKWDLIRWGTLVSAVQSVSADNPLGAKNVKATNNLFPIPDNEIIKDPNLTQNPGY